MKIEEKMRVKVAYIHREEFKRKFGSLKQLDPDDSENDLWILAILPRSLADALSPEEVNLLVDNLLRDE